MDGLQGLVIFSLMVLLSCGFTKLIEWMDKL